LLNMATSNMNRLSMWLIPGIVNFMNKRSEKMHQDNLIRNPHDSPKEKSKEAKDREIIQLIQSRCVHRRIGIVKGSDNVFYCQDCEKILYGMGSKDRRGA